VGKVVIARLRRERGVDPLRGLAPAGPAKGMTSNNGPSKTYDRPGMTTFYGKITFSWKNFGEGRREAKIEEKRERERKWEVTCLKFAHEFILHADDSVNIFVAHLLGIDVHSEFLHFLQRERERFVIGVIPMRVGRQILCKKG